MLRNARLEVVFRLLPVTLLLLLGLCQAVMAQTELFAAPRRRGNGSGSSVENAAVYTSLPLWMEVRSALQSGPVTVTFLDGEYAASDLLLINMGHPEHRLVLQSQSPGGAVFAGPTVMRLAGVQNVTVRHFGFTGDRPNGTIHKLQVIDALMGPGTGPGSARGTLSHNVLIEGNYFYDSPTQYGAISIRNGSHHVTVYNNTFRNVGRGSGAHLIYNYADVHHIKVIGNHFQDSTGDYVRFRHNADYGEVRNNTFISTDSKYNLMFVRFAVFNDVDPGDEYHADNFLVRDNTFQFYAVNNAATQDAVGYTSTGFNPPGVNYLPTAEAGKILTTGTVEQKRQVMLETMNIDMTKVRVYNTTYINVRYPFRLWVSADYGAKSQGWVGLIDFTGVANDTYLGAGDTCSDGVLDEKDIELFLLALDADDEMDFLLDNRVWFGDYQAADINGDGKVDVNDIPAFIAQFEPLVPTEALEPVRQRLKAAP
jgi:hypothetical protein